MKYFISPQTDPHINLALEEYLFSNVSEDTAVFWINSPCVVIGKFQNAYAEANLRKLRDENIPLLRRISGGGCVYHDLGNLNISFIKHGSHEEKTDFAAMIISVLKKIGIDADLNEKGDITLFCKKISGSAQCVKGDKTLHHCTLLVSSDLVSLKNRLSSARGEIISKAVKSIPSPVDNIVSFYEYVDIEMIKNALITELCDEKLDFCISDEIKKLADEKYRNFEWNFGKSPEFVQKISENGEMYEVAVKNGIIKAFESSDLKFKAFSDTLSGCRFDIDDVEKASRELAHILFL